MEEKSKIHEIYTKQTYLKPTLKIKRTCIKEKHFFPKQLFNRQMKATCYYPLTLYDQKNGIEDHFSN